MRKLGKWVIHKVTGRCELLRIQYEEQPGAYRTVKTESSLRNSRYQECQKVLEEASDLTQSVSEIMKIKSILSSKHPSFHARFTDCVERIRGYHSLISKINELRLQKYDETKHVKQLLGLWDSLNPGVRLEERFTRQWGDIGFQGEDPATDFRGMGMLGFENLIFFSQNYTDLARQLVSHSNHPKYGYFFAIVGINITEICNRFMTQGLMKAHFSNLPTKSPTLDDFHHLYCYVFVEFDKLWMKEKPDIMRFNEMRDRLEDQLKTELQKPSVLLSLTGQKAELVAEEI